MQILSIKETDRILIVAPHPDDECIGPGGILALYPDKCDVYVLTDGSLGQGDDLYEHTKAIRMQEFESEMHEAGVKNFKMFGLRDGTLMQHIKCLETTDLERYTKIFVTGPQDNHSDHSAAYFSVLSALEKQRLYHIEVYIYEVHAPLKDPTHMLDITEVMEKKRRLIRFHASQIGKMPYDRLAEVAAEYHALQERMSDRRVEVYSKIVLGQEENYHIQELELKLQKQIRFYQLLTKWLSAKIEGYNIADALRKKGFSNIAIYGYAELGKLVYQELQNSAIEVCYILDKKIKQIDNGDISVFMPECKNGRVDAVVVTAIFYYDEIRAELEELGYENVISLETIIETI